MANKVVLVCGGRNYLNWQRVHAELDAHKPDLVVTGDCPKGADDAAYSWCAVRGVAYRGYPADWRNFGPAAGPIRNSQMLKAEPRIDLVLAFPGGRGTADMVSKARTAGITVIEVKDESGS